MKMLVNELYEKLETIRDINIQERQGSSRLSEYYNLNSPENNSAHTASTSQIKSVDNSFQQYDPNNILNRRLDLYHKIIPKRCNEKEVKSALLTAVLQCFYVNQWLLPIFIFFSFFTFKLIYLFTFFFVFSLGKIRHLSPVQVSKL